jgi:hypothetical protein
MNALESKAQALFLDYSRLSNEALRDAARADIDALAQAFAGYFVGASPTGVIGWAKDETLPATLRQNFEAYRAMGGTRFEIVHMTVEALDGTNAMVRADWEFDYLRPRDDAAGTIAFRNIYFVNFAGDRPAIFAWIAQDEAQAMRDHGLA